MSPRKRRREEAFPEEDEISQHSGALEDAVVDEKERSEKEQEVWDAIREAHYEAIEQLPLTLHRQLSLMRQLDEQTIACTARLLPALVQYISTRQAIANGTFESGEEVTTTMAAGDKDGMTCNGKPNGPRYFALATPLTRLRSGEGQPSAGPSTPFPIPPDRQNLPQTTIELLSYLAWMSEELLRASQEKVNLAQANHDSVERHIQLLDQAIKEQEASLSQDSRGNNGISIHLPEVVAPQLPNRNGRTAQSSSDDDPPVAAEMPPSVPEAAKSSQRGSRKKGKVPAGKQKPESGKDSASLTITLPATQPSEELYCYCNRISFGEMIACDNESCEKEWFHYGCVGLTEPPEGEWFCEDCRVDEA
ncbi:hypothetical protein NLJ89_g282 [Agrocybe chaxingu]|uniref:Chromatin modification-related protein n=1 Tax=Agrocybe chaxingu TaxID=84603 RepID=A0A9W8N2B6_9AGAR|nr:hypothetical protein NLJ89_g282 [Agrocybe chaxingu]